MKRTVDLQPDYDSYLLRLWHDKTPPHPYRIMLQHVVTQQQHFFTDLPTLLTFLTCLLEGDSQAQTEATGKESQVYSPEEPANEHL